MSATPANDDQPIVRRNAMLQRDLRATQRGLDAVARHSRNRPLRAA